MKIQVLLSVILIAVCSSRGAAQINHCPSVCHSWPFKARRECLSRTHHCEVSRCGAQGVQCAPKVTPTPSVTPTPAYGACTGDPHCRTFDGLRFDCQARGEFILARSDDSPHFVLQGRFGDTPHHASVSTGVVMIEEHAPLIQMSMSRLATTRSRTMNSCRVAFFINTQNRDFPDGTYQLGPGGRTQMIVSSNGVTFKLPSGIRVVIKVAKILPWGCMFTLVETVIPGEVIAQTSITGLFGSPNNNQNDDWSTPAGVPIPIPSSYAGRVGATAYHYCAQNWGISHPEDSLFTYELSEEDYSNFNHLSDAPGEVPDITNAPEEVQNICDGSEDCLMDGTVGGMDAAKAQLQAEEEAVQAFEQPIDVAPPSTGPSARMMDMEGEKGYKKMHSHYHSY